ncbi:MAG: hypothetical protein GY849_11675, partial [Deltaproteobacteria bacterium]|nr:hypothetical protein [Deltaproteobacteria bacterium]
MSIVRRGNDFLVQYYLPGLESFMEFPRPRDQIEKEIEPIITSLAGAGRPGFLTAFEGERLKWGESLFRLLFGGEAQWEPVFRTLFNVQDPKISRPNPTFAPVRLRICSEDPRFLSLPFRLTAWNGRTLVNDGWEFLTSHVIDPEQDHELSTPCNILMIAPEIETTSFTPDPIHEKAVEDVIKDVWAKGKEWDYLRTARTKGEIKNALEGARPEIIYVYGPAAVKAGRPFLILESRKGRHDYLALTEFAEIVGRSGARPSVIYLNVSWTNAEETPMASTPGALLGNAAALTIWRPLPQWDNNAGSMFPAWLRHLLENGGDPVTAVHVVADQNAALERALLCVHGAYRDWRTMAFDSGSVRNVFSHLVLNRDHQKALVSKHIKELARSDSRRLMALVAYGAPGNKLDDLCKQLQRYLELDASDVVDIKWRHLHFPEQREKLGRDLEDELKLQLETDNNEPVKHLLRRHGPRVVGTGKRGVLWLNWGVFGKGGDRQAPLYPQHLGEWLRFSSEFLGTHCPADLRI